MVNLSTAQMLRAKIIGALIRDARIAVGESLEDCAQAIGVSNQKFEAYELGEEFISLPELEVVAFFLKVPFAHFWSNEPIQLVKQEKKTLTDMKRLLQLRRRMVGAQIRQARLENQSSLEELSQQVKIDPSSLESFELGQAPIPISLLEDICEALNRLIYDFQDQHGSIGTWESQQRAAQVFHELSPEMQTFISKPVNKPYLEIALKLSEISADRLRTIAEGLLEITY